MKWFIVPELLYELIEVNVCIYTEGLEHTRSGDVSEAATERLIVIDSL